MQIRHNTSLLEKAIELAVQRASIPAEQARAAAEQARAIAEKARADAVARKRLATGVSIAVGAIGIAAAIWLLNDKPAPNLISASNTNAAGSSDGVPPAQTVRPPVTPQVAPAPSAAPTRTPSPSPPRSTEPKVTIDYTKFASQVVRFMGQDWKLTAGHHFASDQETNWTNAWCYTDPDVDGVRLSLELAVRTSPSSAPQAPRANRETLSKANLDDSAAISLAARCPWLDQKSFRPGEIQVPRDRSIATPADPVRVTKQGNTLNYVGPIKADFAQVLRSNTFDRLQISSKGGLISQAMLGGEYLRSSGKIVSVNDECLSACVFVLASGTSRVADKSSKVGVHRFYSTSGQAANDLEVGQQMSSFIIRYLDRMEIDQALFHAMAGVASNDILILDQPSMYRWRLLTAAELPKPEEKPQVFAYADGQDLFGNDLPNMPIRNIDQTGCEEQCVAAGSCVAYSFNKKSNACFLKSQARMLFTESIAISGYRRDRNLSPLISNMQARYKRATIGESYMQLNVASFEGCAARCSSDRMCRAVTFDTQRNQCILLSTVEGETVSEPIMSAVKPVQ